LCSVGLFYNLHSSEREEAMTKRKVMSAAFMMMFGLLLGVSNSYAAPVVGVVDPGANWASTLTGTATYTFTNLTGGSIAPMVALDLGFAGNVFNLASTSVIASSVSSGWSLVTLGNGTYELAILGGAPISPGSSLSFAANYSLIGSALTNGGTPWQQYFDVVYAGSPFFSRGVTSVKTPEASSLILLGSALAGLALWRRRQNATLNM
jgi:PEP-CTERM motif